ncbi:ABC transporter [Pseudonocardia sulfidoxydans NBRC 16205]|uniref:ABC-type quaternary amine transporter n=1 Tax=Pseudonocardia sulfidoxydans NBRC 16205 TaxID=1223511 RepID=A0A511DDY5_9PSEU|nr:ABC transporter ATP-binding protein [Pseudonocardia sulfidoxydans]GEL23011.1 ABC transporter [Pseudonocardia sulfidoxydans NBRC 16205]
MTAALQVRGLSAGYRTPVLHEVDLDVRGGELVSVLGVSGSGKTTLLRAVAGLHPATAGSVALRGRDVTRVAPQHRGIGLVPQEGALFGHLTVARNVGYGLHRSERPRRVADLLARLGLDGLADRMPHELSGGQRQRVALARALAPEPAVVLLDEPFANLDAGLRATVRADVVATLRTAGTAAVLITHDQDEALSVSDRVAVLHEGRIVQDDAPGRLYAAPVTEWLARFVGDATLLPGESDGTLASTPLGKVRHGTGLTGAVTAVVRPEQVALGEGGVSAQVTGVEFHGHTRIVRLLLPDGSAATARVPASDPSPRPGDPTTAAVTGTVHVLPTEPCEWR